MHSFREAHEADGVGMIIAASLINERCRDILDEHAPQIEHGIHIGKESERELMQLFGMMMRRMNNDEAGSETMRALAMAVIEIFIETMRQCETYSTLRSNRTAIALRFRRMVRTEGDNRHRVSWYASRLNISPAYLNECVRETTGVSAGKYIRNETLLRAKRLLAYTSLDIKRIAFDCGFDDCAYFTRLFTKNEGISPSAFRRNYSK